MCICEGTFVWYVVLSVVCRRRHKLYFAKSVVIYCMDVASSTSYPFQPKSGYIMKCMSYFFDKYSLKLAVPYLVGGPGQDFVNYVPSKCLFEALFV